MDKISLGCFFLFAFFVHSPPLSLLVFSLCSAGRVVGSVLGYWRSSYVAKRYCVCWRQILKTINWVVWILDTKLKMQEFQDFGSSLNNVYTPRLS